MDYSKGNIKVRKDLIQKKEFYALTLVLVPTLMVAIIAQYMENFFIKAICYAILLFFQATVVKGMMENKGD